jgi:hypothetical protein
MNGRPMAAAAEYNSVFKWTAIMRKRRAPVKNEKPAELSRDTQGIGSRHPYFLKFLARIPGERFQHTSGGSRWRKQRE